MADSLTERKKPCYRDPMNLIQATYRVLTPKPIDPETKAQSIALGQTTDTWTPNEKSGLQKLEKHRGVVVEAKERARPNGKDYEYELTIGFPPANTEGDIPSLLTMVFGKISLDGKIRLENIRFPDSCLKNKGPQHGIPGIRKRVREPHKPLTMAIFKPCVGLTPGELGRMFFELAMGGMHLVKDDEILPDLSICPVEKRLESCLKAGERAERETGHPTLYAVNLTGRPSRLIAKARRLRQQGAQCFLLNVLGYGYGILEELRELSVPIMAHPALAGALGSAPDTGIRYAVILGSLMRLGGADIVLFPSSYGTVALPESETSSIRQALTQPMGSLRPAFPAPSAGIHPGLVPRLLRDYGADVIINAGGGVHGHPQGARSGARAFRQAIDGEYERPELAEALQLWGKG